jgi:hypothetical protein
MNEQRATFTSLAMRYGTYMGIFWVVKFACFPLGLVSPVLQLLFLAGTIAVPFVAYYLGKDFRKRYCNDRIKYFPAVIFLIVMFVFAALFTAVGHYVYFRYIDGGYILDTYGTMLNTVQAENPLPQVVDMVDQLRRTIEMARGISPIQITMQLFSGNVTLCGILSFLIAPFIVKQSNSSDYK